MATYSIITDKMVFGGDCIAKINEKTVFIPYAIPGEKLTVEITEEHKDYSRAKIVSIDQESPHRVSPFCPLYKKCGGCNMQHIENSFQTKLRSEILRDSFAREGITAPDIFVISDSDVSYRSRFQLHNGSLLQKASHLEIPVDFCPCAVPEINEYLSNVPQKNRPKGRIQIFASSKIVKSENNLNSIIIAQNQDENQVQNPKNKLKNKKQIVKRFEGTQISKENTCTVKLCGKSIQFDVRGFFQSNLNVLEKAIPIITNAEGHHALDLYSGCGTFSSFLAQKFDFVTLVEHNKNAIVFAEQNLCALPHESFGVSGAVWTKFHAESSQNRHGKYDFAIVDPPRSGMEKEVRAWLASSGIERIHSLSCDSATHARDIAFLVKNGYRLEKLYLLDFYPQTCHIESLAVLNK